MCAAIRLSLVSAVWVPVQSMLNTVTIIVIEGVVSFSTKLAEPNEAGRAVPVDVVGVVGGTSCAFVRVALRLMMAASALWLLSLGHRLNTPMTSTRIATNRSMDVTSRDWAPGRIVEVLPSTYKGFRNK